ncbi:hypothetical protein V3C99_003528 [Haemonchus contortus]|uniref:DUF3179 domain-containing protein n=1 Tax=Haemonchus contortus TaxID=6289 RepID=A0A7I4XYA6_HAECO
MASTSSTTTSTSTSTKSNSPTMGSKRVRRQSQLITALGAKEWTRKAYCGRSQWGSGFALAATIPEGAADSRRQRSCGDHGSASLSKRNRRTLPIWQAVLVPPIVAIWASDGNLRMYGTGIATKRSSSSKFGGITLKGGRFFDRHGISLEKRLRDNGFWLNHISQHMEIVFFHEWSNLTFRADTVRWSSNTMTLRRPSTPLRFCALTLLDFDMLLAQPDLDVLLRRQFFDFSRRYDSPWTPDH